MSEIKEADIKKQNYDKYYYLYEITINFLKNIKVDILLYGGIAINEALPKKYKIYTETELPDIDIFTTNAKIIIKLLKQYFKKYHKDIELLYTTEALHPGTYKVFAEGLQLLDITDIPSNDFTFLKEEALQTSLGIRSVGIRFLKFSLHLLSAQSYMSNRWTKDFKRMYNIYELYPPSDDEINWDLIYNNEIPTNIYDNIINWKNTNNIYSFGMDVIEKLIKKPKNVDGFPVLYLLYNGDCKKNKLFKSLDKSIIVSKKYTSSYFMEEYYELSYKNHKICYILEAEFCYSVISNKKQTQLSLHSILALLYKLYISSRDKNGLHIPIIDNLSKLMINYYSKSINKHFNDLYSIKCYGEQAGLITLKRQQIKRKLKNKNILTN